MKSATWRVALAYSILLAGACSDQVDPLFCDATRRCPEPARPFCDLEGTYLASAATPNTCIPEPVYCVSTADCRGIVGDTTECHESGECRPCVGACGAGSLLVVPTIIFDERAMRAGFLADTYRPCFHHSPSEPPGIELAYDVNAAAAPEAAKVYKYSANVAAPDAASCVGPYVNEGDLPDAWQLDVAGNPIVWRVTTRADRGVARVDYRATPPDGVPSAWASASAVSGGAPDTWDVALTGANTAGLSSIDGQWSVDLRIVDTAGAVISPAWPILWQHHLMAGPLYVEALLPTEGVQEYLLPEAHTLENDRIGMLYDRRPLGLVAKVRIHNGTAGNAHAYVFSDVSAAWADRAITVHAPLLTTSYPPDTRALPSCTTNAFSPPDCDRALCCLATRPASVSFANEIEPAFATPVITLDAAGAVVGQVEGRWTVNAGSYIDVYLAGSFAKVWPVAEVAGAEGPDHFDYTFSTRSDLMNLFGKLETPWGAAWCRTTTSTVVTQTNMLDSYDHVRFLSTARMSLGGPAENDFVRVTVARPGGEASPSVLSAMPDRSLKAFAYSTDEILRSPPDSYVNRAASPIAGSTFLPGACR